MVFLDWFVNKGVVIFVYGIKLWGWFLRVIVWFLVCLLFIVVLISYFCDCCILVIVSDIFIVW